MFNRNSVELIGFLAEPPTIGATAGGTKFARFRLVTNRSWKDRATGDWKEASEGHPIATFDPFIVEKAEKLQKGAYLLVAGENRNSRRQKPDGTTEYFYGVFLPNRSGVLQILDRPVRQEGGADRGYSSNEGRSSGGERYEDRGPSSSDDDDEIPF